MKFEREKSILKAFNNNVAPIKEKNIRKILSELNINIIRIKNATIINLNSNITYSQC